MRNDINNSKSKLECVAKTVHNKTAYLHVNSIRNNHYEMLISEKCLTS